MITAQRIVRKQLAGAEDLLLGKGKVIQSRGGGTYDITKLDLIWPIHSLDELVGIDVTKITKVLLISGTSKLLKEYDSETAAWVDTELNPKVALVQAGADFVGYIREADSIFTLSTVAEALKQSAILDLVEAGVVYDGTDEGVKVNAALRWAEQEGKIVTGFGTVITSVPLLVKNKQSVFAPNLNVVADNCNAWLIGADSQSFEGHFEVGDITRKDFYDGGGVIGGAYAYLNSGIVLRACVGQSLYFGNIKGFENALDFNPLGYQDHTSAQQGSAGENRLYGKTIQRNACGVLMRHTGPGTETTAATSRGWVEGNTINASIFGCDIGVKQEIDALATYTKLQGVIDCAQGKDGNTSATSLDIESNIEYGIEADLYFLRHGKFTLKNAATHSLNVVPISGKSLDPKLVNSVNVLENCDFKYYAANGSTANSHWPWTQSGLTASRETDGAMLFSHNTLGAYVQQGIAEFAQYVGNYFTVDITGEAVAPTTAGQVVNIYLYYKDSTGTLVNQQSGNRVLTGRTRFSFLVPSGVKADGAFIRIVNPNPSALATYGLRMRRVVGWKGCNSRLPEYVRPRIIPGRDVPTDMYWNAGSLIVNAIDPSTTSALKLCTVSGTPGTWVTLVTN